MFDAKSNPSSMANISIYLILAISYTKGYPAIFKEKRQKGNKRKRSDFNLVFFKENIPLK